MRDWSTGSGTDEEDAVVAAMLAMHRRHQREREPGVGGYASVVRHLEQRGQRLRAERLVTEELMARLAKGGKELPPPRVHRELVVMGPAEGAAVGRLRVANHTEQAAPFALTHGEAVEGRLRASLTFTPGEGELSAGETRLVRVAASLAGFLPGESLTVPVELRFRVGFDRLWVVVRAEVQP